MRMGDKRKVEADSRDVDQRWLGRRSPQRYWLHYTYIRNNQESQPCAVLLEQTAN